MLQQTQVATVAPYYLRFLQQFPDINSLALASLDDVLSLWSGLGYYARGRNLHRAAQMVVDQYNGIFPHDLKLIQQLPGVGRSTAAAIAVFAYGEECAILDGNVKRVFARYFGIDGYPGAKDTETLLWKKAEELIPRKDSVGQIQTYTQALMDLGATICTRSRPQCSVCPLRIDCIALRENRVDKLPTAKPRKLLPQKETVMLMMLQQDGVLLQKRPLTGIWGGLWCPPEISLTEDTNSYCQQQFGLNVRVMAELPPLDHSFTHFKLRIYPRLLHVISPVPTHKNSILTRFSFEDALSAAIPTAVRRLLMMAPKITS